MLCSGNEPCKWCCLRGVLAFGGTLEMSGRWGRSELGGVDCRERVGLGVFSLSRWWWCLSFPAHQVSSFVVADLKVIGVEVLTPPPDSVDGPTSTLRMTSSHPLNTYFPPRSRLFFHVIISAAASANPRNHRCVAVFPLHTRREYGGKFGNFLQTALFSA